MTEDNFDTYDFIINEEDETMLLLYAREGAPENPSISVDIENKKAVLIRNDNDTISLDDVPDEVLDSLQDADKLLICELSIENEPEQTKIVHAYEAEVTD